jgi:hypothetical protein
VGAVGAWIAAGVALHHQSQSGAASASLEAIVTDTSDDSGIEEVIDASSSWGRRSDSRLLRDIDRDVDALGRLLREHVRRDDRHDRDRDCNRDDDDRDKEFVRDLIKYRNLKVSLFTVVDPARSMFSGGTGPIASNDTARRIPCVLIEPATGPGSQKAVINVVPPGLFDGSFVAQGLPVITSARTFKARIAHTDNQAITNALPLIFIPDRTSFGEVLRRGEPLAQAGFRIVSVYSHKVLTGACPTVAGFCPGAISGRFASDDIRSVKNAIKNNQVPQLPWNRVARRPSNNMPAIGCHGVSAASGWCMVAFAGTKTLVAGSPAAQAQADFDFQAFMSGDSVQIANTAFNETRWNVSMGIWGTALGPDLSIYFPVYNRAPLRVFYEHRSLDHGASSGFNMALCDVLPECGRVFSLGLQTPLDANVCGTAVSFWAQEALAHCGPAALTNAERIPSVTGGYPAALLQAASQSPTSGIPVAIVDRAETYHWATFFWHTLYDSPMALALTRLNLFPEVNVDIYVNSTPGILARPFNLAGRTIQIDLDATRRHNVASSSFTGGPIIVPPGSVSVGVAQTFFNMSFAFPFKLGGIVNSVQQLTVNGGAGLLQFFGHRFIGSPAPYSADKMQRLLEDSGSPILACFGTGLSLGTGGVFVLNTASEFTVTWFNVSMNAFSQSTPRTINAQCSIYPSGRRVIRFDSNVPFLMPTPVPSIVASIASGLVVGYSDGQLHSGGNNKGSKGFDFLDNSRRTSLTEVLAGDDAQNADVIIESYSGGVQANTAGVGGASIAAATVPVDIDFVATFASQQEPVQMV